MQLPAPNDQLTLSMVSSGCMQSAKSVTTMVSVALLFFLDLLLLLPLIPENLPIEVISPTLGLWEKLLVVSKKKIINWCHLLRVCRHWRL